MSFLLTDAADVAAVFHLPSKVVMIVRMSSECVCGMFYFLGTHSNRPRVQLSFCKCNFTISCNVFELVGNELLSKSLQNKMEKSI